MTQRDNELPFKVSRRQFWRALLQEVVVTYDAFKGRDGFALSELGKLPDEQMARVKPILHPDCETFVEQGYVWSRCKETEATFRLFPVVRANMMVFERFDGQHDLGEIGEYVGREMAWEPARGFAHARKLFLLLVSRLVCVPKDPLLPGLSQ
jgi:hypothetical protein